MCDKSTPASTIDIRRVAIYCRTAPSGDAVIADPLDVQEQQCRDYAERHDWEVVNVYRDRATHLDGTAIGLMMLAAENIVERSADAILITDCSRLSRSSEHAREREREFAAAGVPIIVVTGGAA
jgi:DNA invertase Pin-like site-specific DNA recombinase